MSVLQRAKDKQRQVAGTTDVWIRLDLLEGLIAEIENLQHRVEVLSQDHRTRPVRHIAEIMAAAEERSP